MYPIPEYKMWPTRSAGKSNPVFRMFWLHLLFGNGQPADIEQSESYTKRITTRETFCPSAPQSQLVTPSLCLLTKYSAPRINLYETLNQSVIWVFETTRPETTRWREKLMNCKINKKTAHEDPNYPKSNHFPWKPTRMFSSARPKHTLRIGSSSKT